MNLCLDCKHSSSMLSNGVLVCALVQDLIDTAGRECWMRCDAQRHSRHPAACGQMGKFFELKDTE